MVHETGTYQVISDELMATKAIIDQAFADEFMASLAPCRIYPYTAHRNYLCGHPDEFIKVELWPPTQPGQVPTVHHTLILPIKRVVGNKNPYRQSLERCTLCAREHRTSQRQNFPRHPGRKLAAHQGQLQSVDCSVRDGFLLALARYRFQKEDDAQREQPFSWKDEGAEGPDSGLYGYLEDIYVQAEIARASKPHAGVPYPRRDKHVVGPGTDKGYAIKVVVDEALLPPRTPTPPPEPQRVSESTLLEAENNAHADPQPLKRDTAATSLSTGNRPRDTAVLPARANLITERAGPPLPVLRDRKQMLKEKLAGSPSSLRSGRTPRTSDISRLSGQSAKEGSTVGSLRRSQEGGNRRSGGYGSSNDAANRSSQESGYGSSYDHAFRGSQGSGYGSSNDTARPPRRTSKDNSSSNQVDAELGSHGVAELNPYRYNPRSVIGANPRKPEERSRQRANTDRSHGDAYGSSRGDSRSSRRHVSEGTGQEAYGEMDHRPPRVHDNPYEYPPREGAGNARQDSSEARRGEISGVTSRPTNANQLLQAGFLDEESDSDTSSVGGW
jgi:hypothetical protein